jgi:N6-L-threonylcarbamoyladenine synthase
VHVAGFNNFEIMGQTRDDAAGEAFDKISRAVGLGYPGGPLIDKTAVSGNNKAIELPRVSFNDGSLDFSFSGLKTSVLNYLNSMEQKGEKIVVEDLCASFQQAVVDVLVRNTVRAAELKKVSRIALAGGVAANSKLRSEMKEIAAIRGIEVVYPKPVLCTDNAAMIACAAYYEYMSGNIADLSLNAVPGLKLGNR